MIDGWLFGLTRGA